MGNVCYMANQSYSIYDGIHDMIEEYYRCNYNMDLNLDTADKIATFVDEYIRYRLEEFTNSITYKTLDERLYAAVSEEFDVPLEIYLQETDRSYSEKESIAKDVVGYIQSRYLKESQYEAIYDEIDRLIREDGVFAMRIARVKAAIGVE